MADRTNAAEFRICWAYQIGDVSFHDQVTVRCNTKILNRVRHMGTDALPKVIESGKAEERDLDSLPENAIIASVLSSLS